VKTVAGEVAFLHKNVSVGGNWVEIRRNGSNAICFWVALFWSAFVDKGV